MKDVKNGKIPLDEVAESRGVATGLANEQGPEKVPVWKKVTIVSIVLSIYAVLIILLFSVRSLALPMVIAIIAYCFLVGPFLKLLKRIFGINDSKSKY